VSLEELARVAIRTAYEHGYWLALWENGRISNELVDEKRREAVKSAEAIISALRGLDKRIVTPPKRDSSGGYDL
jgi:hypothetical protein